MDALDWNRRVWTALSDDCSNPGNGLPAPLRASIISLSIWVARHTSAVIRRQEQIEPLIEVNRMIMQGLVACKRRGHRRGLNGRTAGQSSPPPTGPHSRAGAPLRAPNPRGGALLPTARQQLPTRSATRQDLPPESMDNRPITP